MEQVLEGPIIVVKESGGLALGKNKEGGESARTEQRYMYVLLKRNEANKPGGEEIGELYLKKKLNFAKPLERGIPPKKDHDGQDCYIFQSPALG